MWCAAVVGDKPVLETVVSCCVGAGIVWVCPPPPAPPDDAILLRKIRLMLDTLGTLNLSHTPSASSRSRISHANTPGSLRFNRPIYATTLGVVTRGLLPPMAPGRTLPVS